MEWLWRAVRIYVYRRYACGLRMIVEEADHRIESPARNVHIRVKEEHEIPRRPVIGLVHSRGESQVLLVLDQDDACPTREGVGRSIDGSVVDDDDFSRNAVRRRDECLKTSDTRYTRVPVNDQMESRGLFTGQSLSDRSDVRL